MARKVTLDSLESVVSDELKLYHEDVVTKMKAVAKSNMAEIVKETKAFRFKRDTGKYRKRIKSKVLEESTTGITYVWYVESPDYRLTHLLNNGHALVNGGRTIGYGFVTNAEARGIEKYQKDLEEVLSK